MSLLTRGMVVPVFAAVVLSACGQPEPSRGESATGAAATAAAPVQVMPDWFPEAYPPPPEEAVFGNATFTEMEMHGGEELPEEPGTVVTREVRLVYGHGSDAEVMDHYRVAFAGAGWEVVGEDELDPDELPSVQYPGWRLRAESDEYTATVTASHREGDVEVRHSATEWLRERAPYSAHPPLVDLPDWYGMLPEPPAEMRRPAIGPCDTVPQP